MVLLLLRHMNFLQSFWETNMQMGKLIILCFSKLIREYNKVQDLVNDNTLDMHLKCTRFTYLTDCSLD